ncbi:MAG: diguanylate cyclase [Firmicutes bacterium]|nr:diguanylate cyclase [Bacillota bacterium]
MNWFRVRYRLFRRWLRNNLCVEEKTRKVALAASIQRIFWTAPIMAVGNFLAGLTFWLQNEPTMAREILWRELIITTNFLVSAISLIFFLVAWRVRQHDISDRVRKVFLYSVVIYVLGVGLIISLIDSLVMTSITPFLLCVTIAGTFYYLPPRNAFIVFSLSFVVFALLFSSFSDFPSHVLKSTLVNGLIVNVMGLALSIVSWQYFCRTTMQQRIIAEQQETLKQMAYHDSLTDLPNRRFLDELIKREVVLVKRQQEESCLIICDIDRFKRVNDTYGHPAGDELLREFADLLQSNLSSNNILVRLGGEEFVILARSAPFEQSVNLAEKLRKLVEEHEFKVDHHVIRITASFGVAALRGTEGAHDYYCRADQALYQAKQAGRNQVVTFSI